MSKRTFLGGATATQQVATITMNADTNGNTYGLTLADELGATAAASFTSTGAGTSANATGLAAAINASNDPRFKGVVTATALSTAVTITASVQGVPFYPTLSGTGSAQMTLTATTPNSGPNDWNTAANWAENTIPVNGDDVTISGTQAIKYGVKTGLTLGNFLSAPGSSNQAGRQGIPLSFICTSFNWYGTGVSWIDVQTSAIPLAIWASASGSGTASGLNLLGSAITTLTNMAASVGVCMVAGSTSTITTLQHISNGSQNAVTRLRTGTTVTTVTGDGGTLWLDVAATTVSFSGGNVYTNGSGAIATVTNNGAAMVLNSTGTITTLNNNSGTADFTQSLAARTVTNPKLAGGSISYDPGVVTFTNPILTNAIGPQTITSTAA